ncbi:ASCH domain-containing protein [Deinococcus hopiensis]|uniref:Uncharacterized protein YhfF n=1 Tax=Deinococcus hopiensis KR-140 TaxID=695939 RepID=A0A1W1UPG9_9DEIO|nr:ASCH domain-containing protein [Deinococcus hopiensis]SMB83025.1 Uncharacterized protein YhfF [Deinococcus hopiensis KR-140]
MKLSPHVHAFVRQAEEQTGEQFQPQYVFAFGDSPALKDELLALVLYGEKRATATLVEGFALDGEAEPQPGDVSVVLDGRGTPRAIIRTVEVRRVPFAAVDAAFAWDEAEGDRSLEVWQEGHRRYFGREAQRLGIEFNGESLVFCERFELVYAPPPPQG